MKKIVFLGLMIVSVFLLVGCSNTAASATFDNIDRTSKSITFDVTVDDPDSEITGYTYVKIYDQQDEVLDSTLLTFVEGETSLTEEALTFDALDSETIYTLKVIATIEKKNVELATYEFETQTETDLTINTAEEFMEMSTNRSGNFLLGNDIDFSGVEFVMPFPSGKSFLGTFDGQGYTLSNITIPTVTTYTGVFGNLSTGSITNLNLDNITIGDETNPYEATASSRVGFLTGYVSSSAGAISDVTISNSQMFFKSSSTISTYVGGAVGEMRGTMNNVAVNDSSINVEITAKADVRVGGVIGYLYEDAVVNQVSSSGEINFVLNGNDLGDGDDSYVDIAGVIGRNDATDVTDSVTELYSSMDLNVEMNYNTLEETNSANYSLTVGGLIGYSTATIKEGFYSGSIDVTQVSSAFEANANIRFNVAGLIGKYFGRLELENLIRFGSGANITVSTSNDVIVLFDQLVAYDVYSKTHVIGVVGPQNATINGTVITDLAPVITNSDTFFTSEFIQNEFDLINVA